MLGEVNDSMANNIVAQLTYLDHINKDEPISIIINSPGGSVTAGLSIYDTMNSLGSSIHTICTGQACSMGAFILSAGDYRIVQPSARVMIHQPLGGFSGQATDIEIHAQEMRRIKGFLNGVLAHNCNKTVDEIIHNTERDNFMSAFEALDFGLVDEVAKQSSISSKRSSSLDLKALISSLK